MGLGIVRYSNFVGNGVGVRANSGSVEVSGNRFYGNTSGIYVNGGTLKIVGNEIRAGGSGINHGGGYVTVMVRGDVGAVKAAVDAGIEVYNSIFESNGYGISDTSSNLIVRGE